MKETTNINVPFLDLRAQYQSMQEEIDSAIASVIADVAFVRGKFVSQFEDAFASACGVRHCVGVANGTDALFVAIKALGIGPGDEVITAANSWIASSEVITLAGASPVFVDVEADSFNMDPDDLARKLSERTKAVIPVHLYGQAADLDPILALTSRHGLPVIEDSAQAHFANYRGKRVGTFGSVATFSFYPGKNLGAYGDAGAVVTDDPDLARAMRMFANHGSDPTNKHNHLIEGINSRLDGIQAAILSAKLPYAEGWNQRRADRAGRYSEALAGVGDLVLPAIRPGSDHVFHVYCVRTAARDELQQHLKEVGVATSIHYPTALPYLDAYTYMGAQPEDYPVAYENQSRILSLPMYPELTDEQIDYVVRGIEDFFSNR